MVCRTRIGGSEARQLPAGAGALGKYDTGHWEYDWFGYLSPSSLTCAIRQYFACRLADYFCGAVFLALLFGRLAAMIPKGGRPYAYTRLGFGDFAGFWIAWSYWISAWI
ncbi:hypothetical protein KSF_065300 [Reticulibacter mediterranei]|uniref:Uncharacterized protein n=1 Tax=Reticulibacter mediterranei TaxID=2778369 RepID=A0A8J3N6U4_9CHLR|nr:hypothetical protein [Reticulibacter mediterranei]GHO96482.1 hypothetical protein KSF_065300 [Reticulibacter mediterranei]